MAVTGKLYWYAGLGHLSDDDIADSRKFLLKVYRQHIQAAEAGKRRLVVAGGHAVAYWQSQAKHLPHNV